MDNEPYNDWLKIFDEELKDLWYTQAKEIRIITILIKALTKEVKKMYKNMKTHKIYEDQQPIQKDLLNENVLGNDLQVESDLNITSSEVFICSSLPVLNNITNLDSNPTYTSDKDNIVTNKSPKLNKRCKATVLKSLQRRSALNYSALKLCQTPNEKKSQNDDIVDSTIIQTTPDAQYTSRIKQKKIVNPLKKSKKKNLTNNTTIPQILTDVSSSTKNDSSIDETYCPSELIISRSSLTKKLTINPEGAMELDSGPEYSTLNLQDDISLKCVDEKEIKIENAKTETRKHSFVYKEDPVRGKARAHLPGWECSDCEKFYSALDLNPEEKKQQLNKCSRHRSKFAPESPSPNGFWKLAFTPTPKRTKKS